MCQAVILGGHKNNYKSQILGNKDSDYQKISLIYAGTIFAY